ncbi:hypothetical protein ACFQ2B_37845 [Streptomyces stramineus]|uniref:Helix-turn-helix domain-containing protein n=1 Tax=Streptomyces stramineus TaxID=173861 RepID=A0ABN1A987_9ACTN
MLTHVIAPARFFSQVRNEIIRHPRLSADAVRLLLWHLSLPAGAAEQPLSTTARQANIKKSALTRVKRELTQEGYFHQWRAQGADGLWATSQLISNVPLTAEQALAARDGRPAEPAQPAQPADDKPAPGEPARRAVGHSPEKNMRENTSHPPHPLADRGAQALAAASRSERRLRLSGRDITRLAPLAGEWLLRGATLGDLREALTAGLPERVHSPAGITRDRLLRKMPEPSAARPAPAPRPAALQLCTGGCERMIRPVGDETRCRDCRLEAAATGPCDGAVAATLRGMAAIRASLRTPTGPCPSG